MCVPNSVKQRKRTADGGLKKRYAMLYIVLPLHVNFGFVCFELDLFFLIVGRDNDLHRLLFMPNGLPDGAELTYFIKGQVLFFKGNNNMVDWL